jgi:hypothetical protein
MLRHWQSRCNIFDAVVGSANGVRAAGLGNGDLPPRNRINRMKVILAAAALLATPVFLASASAETLTFGGEKTGTIPTTFETALTGQGKPGRWEVVEDATAEGGRALAQLSAETTDYHFPLAIYRPASGTDVEATIRFKPVSGRIDQAGGVVVRYIDADNYYLTRANALENNVTFYRVVKGSRQQIASAAAQVASGQWHTLTLKAEADRFTVTLDGKPMITASDRTFAGSGRVGFWTKADSVTRFDRLDVKINKP